MRCETAAKCRIVVWHGNKWAFWQHRRAACCEKETSGNVRPDHRIGAACKALGERECRPTSDAESRSESRRRGRFGNAGTITARQLLLRRHTFATNASDRAVWLSEPCFLQRRLACLLFTSFIYNNTNKSIPVWTGRLLSDGAALAEPIFSGLISAA
jgi:hypothetical protein